MLVDMYCQDINVYVLFEIMCFHWCVELRGGRIKSFRERVPPNLDKIKAMVHGRHATGDLSFSPAMGASGSQRRGVQQNLPVDLQEHMGDRDQVDEYDYNEQTQLSDGEKSQSPPRSIHTNTRKCRSEGGSSGEGRRLT